MIPKPERSRVAGGRGNLGGERLRGWAGHDDIGGPSSAKKGLMMIDGLVGGLHQLASHVWGGSVWQMRMQMQETCSSSRTKPGPGDGGVGGEEVGGRGMQMHAAAAVVVAGAGDAPHTMHHAAPGTSAAMTCDMGRCWMHVAMQPHACVSLWGTLDPPTTPRLLVPVFEFN